MSRIEELRAYLLNIITNMTNDNNFQINADMLSNNIGDYSLDKMPTEPQVEEWIIGIPKKRDVYSLWWLRHYWLDTMTNLKNIGFFEKFEKIIKSNNDKGILPNIDKIESINCLNCGTLIFADTKQAILDIQIEVTYIDDISEVSLWKR